MAEDRARRCTPAFGPDWPMRSADTVCFNNVSKMEVSTPFGKPQEILCALYALDVDVCAPLGETA
jgi:hypothetical protein